MSVQNIEFNDENFDTETAQGVSVICFGDPRELACVKQHKVIEKAAETIKGEIKIGKCDIKNCFKLAQRFHIPTIPTIIIFKDGKEVEHLAGFRHEGALIKHLSAYFE